MNLFRRSLSEDVIDRFVHVWSVLFFLALAFLSWTLSFSPVFSYYGNQRTGPVAPSVVTRPEVPTYKATCWAPPHVTGAHIDYIVQTCAAFMNMVQRGAETVPLYTIPQNATLGEDIWSLLVPYKPTVMNETSPSAPRPTAQTYTQEKDAVNLEADMFFFIAVAMPSLFFIFAISLKAPNLMNSISTRCGGVNFDQTLRAASQALALDADSRQRLLSDLSQATAKACRTSRHVSFGYVLCKLFVCIVLVVELIALDRVALSQLEDLKARNGQLEDKYGNRSASSSEPEDAVYEYDNNLILACQLDVHQLANIQSWTVQCLFNYDYSHSAAAAAAAAATSSLSSSQAGSMTSSDRVQMEHTLLTYEALVLDVRYFLLCLLALSLVSLLFWLYRLVRSCRRPPPQGAALSFDLRFLLLMSGENCDPLVTQTLTNNLATAVGGNTEARNQEG